MKPLSFAWRALRREVRYGELGTLAAALVLAVASLCAVATLGLRVERAIVSGAGELIGGDFGIASRNTVPEALRAEAMRLGLATSRSAEFPSVLFANDRSQLCQVRASDAGYPLRGQLRVRGVDGIERSVRAPGPGTAYLEARALEALGLAPGDTLTLGDRPITVAGVIVREPDSGSPFQLAPRAAFALADVEASGLLGPGSRARHRLMVAGEAPAVRAFRDHALQNLPDGAQPIVLERSQRNLERAFERGEAFLRLAALLAALLSGIAVALAAQRYARRKTDEVALLRCLGASRREVLAATGLTLALLALPACLLGALLGLGLQEAVFFYARDLLPGATPELPLAPAFASFAVGLAVLFGFALPPILRLRETPPVRVFQRAAGARVRRFDAWYLLPFAVSAALIYTQAGAPRLAAILGASLFGVGLLALAGAALLMALVNRAAPLLPGALRFGLANLVRRRALSLVQAMALSLSLTALYVLAVVGPTLLSAWRAELPPDTPNTFVINLQPEQLGTFEARVRALDAHALNMLPLAAGKLTAINGKPPRTNDDGEERGGGEIRVSWSSSLPEANTLTAGSWFAGTAAGPEISVEKVWVERYGIGLGDTVGLTVGEREITATVTSLRVVDWDSFRANFFLLLDPATGAGLPHSYVASFHLPPERTAGLQALSRELPNLSMIDLNAILDRVREIIARVSAAVSWVLGFSLLAGLLVLVAALSATAEERRFEAALMRTLGADRGQLRAAVLGEFALLGLLAGVVSAVGAGAAGTLLARSVFKIDYAAPWVDLALAAAVATGVVAMAGWLGTRRISRTSPLLVLRRA